MRKLGILVALLGILSLFAGCGSTKAADDAQKAMEIKPAVFSAETKEVLDMVGLEREFFLFDFTTDDTIKSVYLTTWNFQEGEWVEAGRTQVNLDPNTTGRVAIQVSDDQVKVTGINIGAFQMELPQNYSKSTMAVSTGLSMPTKIERNQEILLRSKIGAVQFSMSTAEAADFRNADCNAGVAFTITFSDEYMQ